MKLLRTKKAAMFGLDARIALAIFGALSVISGAALYGAIQNAKVTAVIADANEVAKAVEAYYLDTGELPPLSSTNAAANLNVEALTTAPSGVTGWNGPYLGYTESSTVEALNHPTQGNLTIAYRRVGDWTDFVDGFCKKSDSACEVYVIFENANLALNQAIEKQIDGTAIPGVENYTGKIRFNASWLDIKMDIPVDPSISPTS
tara:strand:- start:2421 stop:3029 length:609 start_codon:yes stop_codon:yes gene_type:complete